MRRQIIALALSAAALTACAAPERHHNRAERAQQASAAAPQQSAAERAGLGRFDASGNIPCAQRQGQPMGQCPFGVARDPGGSATVVVTRPDGRTRTLFFENGRFLTADTSQADGSPSVSARREGDLNIVQIGAERYEIPDAVIVGG